MSDPLPPESRTLIPDAAFDGLLQAVRHAARTVILPRFRNLSDGAIDTKSSPTDLVTIADREAEVLIAQAAARLLPEALIVGEEAAHADPGVLERFETAELAVIIDPIDGTSNFVGGLAVFGVILAVTWRGQAVLGLLYDPVLDDWIVARRGEGAWFCRDGAAPRRLAGPPPRSVDQAHGYIPLFLYPRADRPRIAAAFSRFDRVSALRCSCHEYRMLAFGHADFIVSPLVKPWDHAAGTLIVEECGGKVMSGGAPGYDAARPKAPLFVLGNAASAIGPEDVDGACGSG